MTKHKCQRINPFILTVEGLNQSTSHKDARKERHFAKVKGFQIVLSMDLVLVLLLQYDQDGQHDEVKHWWLGFEEEADVAGGTF